MFPQNENRNEGTFGKIQRGAHKRGLKPQIFRENRGEILPGKSGRFGANWRHFRAGRGLFGADRDQFLCTPQPRGKSRNCPERALFGPIGPFRAKPPFAKPPFGFPRYIRKNHPFTNAPFYLPVKKDRARALWTVPGDSCQTFLAAREVLWRKVPRARPPACRAWICRGWVRIFGFQSKSTRMLHRCINLIWDSFKSP